MDNANEMDEATQAWLEGEEQILGVRLALENGQLVEQDGFAGPCPCGLRTLDECSCFAGRGER